MVSNIISCSIPPELAEFLENNKDLSPSKILQAKLLELKNDEARFEVRLKALEIRNGDLRRRLENVLLFLEEKHEDVHQSVLKNGLVS